jgi:hypothetical protein
MLKLGRFGLAIVTTMAFSLEMSSAALAWDFAPDAAESAATTTGFIPNQNVNINFSGKIVTVHTTPAVPTILPYNPAIPIVNVEPVVTSGQRPLVVGGAPCTVTIYGADAAGNLYNISSAAWMSPPQIIQWSAFTSGPAMPGNLTPAQLATFIQANVLDLGYSTVPSSPGRTAGMSFSEQAPANSPDTVSNIQVTAIVAMDNPLSGGSIQSWSFNDLVSTVAAGTIVPPPAPTYDITVQVPAIPPYTMRLLNVPAASLTAAP